MGFSRASKRRLKRLLAGVDRREKTVFVTLTFPRSGPQDPDVCHALMRKWDKRIVRNFSKFGLLWRRAWQVRGTPHYHLVAWPPKGVEVEQFLDCMRREWVDVAGDGSGWFRAHGFRGEPVECLERVGGYLCRREKVLGRGRPWSTFRHGLIPIRYEHAKLDRSQYLKIRRVLGRLSRPFGGRDRRPKRVRSIEARMHAYVSHRELSKLLALLGVSTT